VRRRGLNEDSHDVSISPMKPYLWTFIRACLIALAASFVGIGLNAVSSKPLPWTYVPPRQIEFDGIRVPFVDEKEARSYFQNEEGTIFIDTRHKKDFDESHIKGALFIEADEKEEHFIAVQPLLPTEARLILYCYGPECEMAEQVARFLAQMGYRDMLIMTAGFRAWEKAGYPVEGEKNR
jgi:rhodanese-related sulfurtransferase